MLGLRLRVLPREAFCFSKTQSVAEARQLAAGQETLASFFRIPSRRGGISCEFRLIAPSGPPPNGGDDRGHEICLTRHPPQAWMEGGHLGATHIDNSFGANRRQQGCVEEPPGFKCGLRLPPAPSSTL